MLKAVPVCCLLLLIAGCAHSPPAQDLSVIPLASNFGGASFGDDRGEILSDRWWQHFDDPALDRLIGMALDGNFSIAATYARLAESAAVVRERSGERQPSLDLEASVSASKSDGADWQDTWRTGLVAGYELDLWGRLESLESAAQFEFQATEADLQAARISLTADTASTYYELIAQQAIVDLLTKQQDLNRRVAELLRLRVVNGLAPLDDLLRQRRLIEAGEVDIIDARQALFERREQLAVLLGKNQPQLSLPERSVAPSLPETPATGLPAEWLKQRPDLKAAWLRVNAADQQVAAAIARQYPRISLSADLSTTAAAPSDLFQRWLTSLAANLALPLFDGGQLRAQADQQVASRNIAFNQFAQAVLEATADVETALAAERFNQSRLNRLETQVTLARQAAERLRQRYLNGDSAYLDVLSAQIALQDSERALLAANWQQVQDRIGLVRALAGGWESDAAVTPSETIL